MKNRLIPILFSLLSIGCGNVYERQAAIYDQAVESLTASDSLAHIFENVLVAEAHAAREIASLPASEKGRLYELQGEEDAVYAALMRDSLLATTGRAVMHATTHFVEDRTVLYRTASVVYGNAESAEELDSVGRLVKRYSSMLYRDGQRVCDPPKIYRQAYDEAKRTANRIYDEKLMGFRNGMD